ncbi:MAG: electron transport complex subunit RsxC [Ruminococcaceae bacterium]|nr:electron transport complex subunit RsxC [Oscillospiraceae bacterium]
MARTFRGGFHPPERKDITAAKKIVALATPNTIMIPMSQHIGAPCKPLVKVGDEVKMGQKIGEPSGFVSVPVHSSVSGKVIAIEERPHTGLGKCLAVVIENDGLNTVCETVIPKNPGKMSAQELVEAIKEAGIVGMGGATFPTFIKLSPPEGKKADCVILNGAECEPFLTADHRMMLEHPDDIIDGLKIMMKILNVHRGYIAIEDNKQDAFRLLSEKCKEEFDIEVILVKTKYPQGSEKQLIDSVLKREVKSGQLPIDAGVVVQNVASAAEISTAIRTGMPLIKRVVTVSGSGAKNPENLLVRIGTPLSCLAEHVGLTDGIKKVLAGGPMMGTAQYTLEAPVMKGTSGLLFFTDKEYRHYEPKDCLKCGRCVKHCPMRLMPLMIMAHAELHNYDQAVRYGLKDCMECGTCSYICPSRRHLVQTIKIAKASLPKKQ